MKTMTCRDMGGPCDYKMTAETAEEMIKKGNKHVTMVKDDAHMKIAEQMKSMSDVENKNWNNMFMKKWNMLKE
jgi:predicted small metal-binding protein